MSKSIKTMLLVMLMAALATIPVLAAAPSLDQVANGNQQTVQSTQQAQSGPVAGNPDQSFIDGISAGTDFSQPNQTVTEIQQAAKGPISIVFQLLAWVITLALTARTLVDLLYIVCPPLRGFLSGGAQGMAGNPAGGQPGMAGGMGMGGMAGGMGMNGMGGGMYGRGGGMYGRGMGMGGMAGGMGAQQGMAGRPATGTCWVSQAALDAVAYIDPATGRSGSPFKIYVKDMTVTLVLTAVLLVLTITGILPQIGFMIGQMIQGGLQSVINGGL